MRDHTLEATNRLTDYHKCADEKSAGLEPEFIELPEGASLQLTVSRADAKLASRYPPRAGQNTELGWEIADE